MQPLPASPLPPPPASFRRRMLQGLALALYRRPFWSLLLLSIITGLSIWSALRLEVSADLGVSAPADPSERESREALKTLAPSWAPVTAAVSLRPPAAGRGQAKPKTAELLSPANIEQTRRTVVAELQEAWDDPAFLSEVFFLDSRWVNPETPPALEDVLAALRPGDLKDLRRAEDRKYLREALAKNTARREGEAKADRKYLTRLSSDPLDFSRRLFSRVDPVQAVLPVNVARPYVDADEETLVFLLQPVRPPGEFFYCGELTRFLTNSVEALNRRNAPDLPHLSIRLYGRHIDTSRSADKIRIDLVRVTSVLAVCFVLLLLLAFRKFESLVFILAPPAAGLCWAYGAAACLRPEFTLLSAVFPLLMSALGFEYAIQIYHRFTEELNRERRYYPAIATAYTEAGRGLIVSAVAMLLILLSLCLSPLAQLREAAVMAGLALLCYTLSTLLLLPPLAAIKSRLAGDVAQPLETWDFQLRDFSAAVISTPRITLALGLLLTAYLGFYARDTEINRRFGLDMSAAENLAVRKENPGSPVRGLVDTPLCVLTRGGTLEETLRRNDVLYANLLEGAPKFGLGVIRSLSPFLPARETQRETRRALEDFPLDVIDKNLRAAASELGWKPGFFFPFSVTLTALRKTARETPPRVPPNPQEDRDSTGARLAALAQSHLLRMPGDGGFAAITSVFPGADSPVLGEKGYYAFRREAGGGLPFGCLSFLSDIPRNAMMANRVLFTMALTVFVAFFSLVICLVSHFKRHVKHGLLALAPLFCAAIWTLGVFSLLKAEISLYTLLGLPLIIGLSMNQSILFIQRLHERRYASLRQVMRDGGRPGVISGIFLVLVMGSLAQVRFKPLQDISLALGLAVAVSALCTLALVPTALQIRWEGGLGNWHEEEEEEEEEEGEE